MSDLISRQAVEEMIKAEMPERGMWEIEGDKEKETVCEVCVDLMQKLSDLPSVTPQPKYEDIAKAFQIGLAFGFGEKYDEMDKVIEEVKKAVAPQPKPGKWIASVDKRGDIVTTVNGYNCSECGEFDVDKDNYCPNCGAKMEGYDFI